MRFDFSARAFAAFLTAVGKRNYILLMPDPVKREIWKHMIDRATSTAASLAKLDEESPFVRLLPGWPYPQGMKEDGQSTLKDQLLRVTKKSYKKFLDHFQVEFLQYEEVSLVQIMDWYFKGKAPFGTGKKSKEFPDAVSFASIAAYAKRSDQRVAVVSGDTDWLSACEDHVRMHHFKSLQEITEAILNSKSTIKLIRKALGDFSSLVQPVTKKFSQIFLSHSTSGPPTFYLEQVVFVDLKNVLVIGIGGRDCTVSFVAEVTFTFSVYHEGEPVEPWASIAEDGSTFTTQRMVSGTGKVSFDDEWKEVTKVGRVEFDRFILVLDQADFGSAVE